MRAIQRRAPTRSSARLDGTSKQEIGEEEHAGAEAEHRVGDADVGVHRQLGEADVDPVEIGDEVAEHEKRHETPSDLGHDATFDVIVVHWIPPVGFRFRRESSCVS